MSCAGWRAGYGDRRARRHPTQPTHKGVLRNGHKKTASKAAYVRRIPRRQSQAAEFAAAREMNIQNHQSSSL